MITNSLIQGITESILLKYDFFLGKSTGFFTSKDFFEFFLNFLKVNSPCFFFLKIIEQRINVHIKKIIFLMEIIKSWVIKSE